MSFSPEDRRLLRAMQIDPDKGGDPVIAPDAPIPIEPDAPILVDVFTDGENVTLSQVGLNKMIEANRNMAAEVDTYRGAAHRWCREAARWHRLYRASLAVIGGLVVMMAALVAMEVVR